jgi:4-alpha-glucanotransferase
LEVDRLPDLNDRLTVIAEAFGIEPEYVDNSGQVHVTAPETALKILRAKGVRIDRAVAEPQSEILVASTDNLPERWVASFDTVVQTVDDKPAIESIHMKIRDEGGSDNIVLFKPGEVFPVDRAGSNGLSISIPFPKTLQIGIYSIVFEARVSGELHTTECRWIICPEKAYVPPELEQGRRICGVNVALYGVRSEKNWGVGDFSDLRRIIDWAADSLKVDFVGLNPLHALFNIRPSHSSPYNPSSRFFRNFIYLDVPGIPFFRDSHEASAMVNRAEDRGELQKLRDEQHVNYEKVSEFKLKVLKEVFRTFLENQGRKRSKSLEWRNFQDYIESQGTYLEQFATFCALREHFLSLTPLVTNWREWPRGFQDPSAPEVETFRKEHSDTVLFWMFLQWQIEEQLREVQEYALKKGMLVGLYHDEALGVDANGADSWAYQGLFHYGFSVGAPPDPLGPDGQDWGFPPPNRETQRTAGYAAFLDRLQSSCRYGGALRIDHIMQMRRLFWIPEGQKPADGVYVRNYESELLNLVSLVSQRYQTLIVGEDLGTVPFDFRERLMAKGLFSYRLFYFEWDAAGNLLSHSAYPPNALASINTHDLPTLAGFWSGRDIDIRFEIGQIDKEQEARFRHERRYSKGKMIEKLVQEGFLPAHVAHEAWESPYPTEHLHSAILSFLFRSPCSLVMINQEDVLLDSRQQNIPGTTSEYPNWVTKMRFSVEQLLIDPEAVRLSNKFRDLITTENRSRK